MKKSWFITLAILTMAVILVWLAVFSFSDGKLRIITCDVGQGDAFFVTLNNFQLLIDVD